MNKTEQKKESKHVQLGRLPRREEIKNPSFPFRGCVTLAFPPLEYQTAGWVLWTQA